MLVIVVTVVDAGCTYLSLYSQSPFVLYMTLGTVTDAISVNMLTLYNLSGSRAVTTAVALT